MQLLWISRKALQVAAHPKLVSSQKQLLNGQSAPFCRHFGQERCLWGFRSFQGFSYPT